MLRQHFFLQQKSQTIPTKKNCVCSNKKLVDQEMFLLQIHLQQKSSPNSIIHQHLQQKSKCLHHFEKHGQQHLKNIANV